MNGVLFLALVTVVKSSEARLIQGTIYDVLTQTRMKHHMKKCGMYEIQQQYKTHQDFHKHKGTFCNKTLLSCQTDKLKACQSIFLHKFLSLLILLPYNLENISMATADKQHPNIPDTCVVSDGILKSVILSLIVCKNAQQRKESGTWSILLLTSLISHFYP